MKNNEQLKNLINTIGIDRTMQCLIEVMDDSIMEQDIVPSWKIKVVDCLEQAYDAYMTRHKNSLYENA